MAYPQNSLITKTNMIADFNSRVITARNSVIIFCNNGAGWTPAAPGTPGNPFSPFNSQGTLVAPSDSNPLADKDTASLSTTNLPSVTVQATEIYNAFVGRAQTAGRIRNVRLIKWLNRTGFASNNGYNNVWDYTRYGSMNAAYEPAYSTGDFPTRPIATNTVNAANLDSFVGEIVTKVTASANTAVTFNEYYCHSSCHSSCHNSRGRR